MDNSSSSRIAQSGKRAVMFILALAMVLVAALAVGASFHLVLVQDQHVQGIMMLGLGCLMLYFAGRVLD